MRGELVDIVHWRPAFSAVSTNVCSSRCAEINGAGVITTAAEAGIVANRLLLVVTTHPLTNHLFPNVKAFC